MTHDDKREELEYEVELAEHRLEMAKVRLHNHDAVLPQIPPLPPLPPFIRRLALLPRIPSLASKNSA